MFLYLYTHQYINIEKWYNRRHPLDVRTKIRGSHSTLDGFLYMLVTCDRKISFYSTWHYRWKNSKVPEDSSFGSTISMSNIMWQLTDFKTFYHILQTMTRWDTYFNEEDAIHWREKGLASCHTCGWRNVGIWMPPKSSDYILKLNHIFLDFPLISCRLTHFLIC